MRWHVLDPALNRCNTRNGLLLVVRPPRDAAEAVVDGMTAAALAGYGEIIAMRWGG